MLVDKSVELDSLKTKLRSFEENLKELTEYRQLKCNVYKKEFQKCDNPTHTKELLILQNELHNSARIIEDKNQLITNLNSNNKDLTEKIEEMLLQTRNEIQNISAKYNMPQLEIMRKELEKAEYTEKFLSKKLEESEERRLGLLQKLKSENDRKDTDALLEELEKCRDDLRTNNNRLLHEREYILEISKQLEHQKAQIQQLKNELEDSKSQLRKSKNKSITKNGEESDVMKNEYDALKKQLRSVMEHLEKNGSCSSRKEYPEIVNVLARQMDSFIEQTKNDPIEKGILEEQINSWKKLLDQIEIKDPDETLKSQYQEAVMNLHARDVTLKQLQGTLNDLKGAFTTSQDEKNNLNVELKECRIKLESAEKLINNLETEVGNLRAIVKKADTSLINGDTGIEVDKLQKDLKLLNEQLKTKEHDYSILLEAAKKYDQEKRESRKLLEKLKSEVDKLKTENAKLHLEVCNESKNTTKLNSSEDKQAEFKNRLEEELMKSELKLRDELQIEYQKRIADIEKRYQKTFKETTELCKKQKHELEDQDKKFREYLKTVLTECEACTTKLENEKLEISGQLQMLKQEYEGYKATVIAHQEKYCAIVKKMEKEAQKNNEAWKDWSKKLVCSCLDIEATNKKVRDRVLANMERYDQEVAVIQKLADARKEKKYKKLDHLLSKKS